MPVFVDSLFWHTKANKEGNEWCHMKADTIEELHAFAQQIGRNNCWFHKDHYDLTPSFRQKAIAAGAIPLTRREWTQHFPRQKDK